MDKWKVVLLNGEEETVGGYAIRWTDGVLAIRTSHQGSYDERWIRWPLTSIESWRRI